jgi:DNA-binding protein H-NS
MAREKTSASDLIPLLDGLTVGDLDKVIAAAEQQREAKRESAKNELRSEFKARAEALGLSLGDLVAGSSAAGRPSGKERSSRKGPSASSPAAKYRNAETGETWSGRGRPPKWVTLAEQQGRSREELAIKG